MWSLSWACDCQDCSCHNVVGFPQAILELYSILILEKDKLSYMIIRYMDGYIVKELEK